jgi:7,8-dihydropterin-6-yl-methyl-4-(beta-D-ribofuranosyl)aminobenzene 5'-phosphate synthase
MCDSPGDAAEAGIAAPRLAHGTAVDPIGLEPVDEVVVTTLVDNVFDALLTGDARTSRVS